jgi:hypothetical protein
MKEPSASTRCESEMGRRKLAQSTREFGNHSKNGVGEIILHMSFGLRNIKWLCSPLHETFVPFEDCASTDRFIL